MISIDEFVAGLDRCKKSANGFTARCPVHEDGTASLSIAEGDQGIVVKCFANCDPEAIVKRMGFEWSDLFYEPLERTMVEPEITYDYVDEEGALLFQVVRKPPKRFLQRMPGDDGEWVYQLNGVRRVPYRLPELLEAAAAGRQVLIPEGEKDVEAIRRAGGAATCNPGGAGKWDPAYAEYLRGANGVWVIADPDEAGLKHAQEVLASLEGIVPAEIRVAKAGKDAYDHLEEHKLELKDFRPYVGQRRTVNFSSIDLSQPLPPTKWLVEDVCVRGEVTLLVGDGGIGKSFFTKGLALAITGGVSTMFAGKSVFEHGPVVVVDEENSPDLVLERLHKLGLTDKHLENLHYLCGQGVDLTQGPDRLLEDLKAVEPVLVVLDSQSRVLLGVDENSNADMSLAYRRSIIPLARETGAAVLMIHHTSADRNGKANPRGATGIRNAADQVLSFVRKDDESILMWASKARRRTRPLRFKIEDEAGGKAISINPVTEDWRAS